MLDDHDKLNTALRDAAARTDLNLPSSLDRLRAERMGTLDRAQGDFRRRYVEFQEQAHEEAVRVYEEYAKAGDNPRFVGLAEDTLPLLRAHKREIDAIAAR
jgi:putative membrane protein